MRKIFTKPVVYSLYGISIVFLFIGIIVLGNNPTIASLENPDFTYDILGRFAAPVNNEVDLAIGRPYTDNNVTIVQNYYDYKSTEDDQRKSLIQYQDTYIQSTGISYQLIENSFDVVAVLAGEVIEVKTDELIGNRITIKHSESVTSIYQSIDEISVKKGDSVTKGMLLGKSGSSNINASLKNHLYFELIIDKNYVNPEGYYDKTL